MLGKPWINTLPCTWTLQGIFASPYLREIRGEP